jgi:hypothetical protein
LIDIHNNNCIRLYDLHVLRLKKSKQII